MKPSQTPQSKLAAAAALVLSHLPAKNAVVKRTEIAAQSDQLI